MKGVTVVTLLETVLNPIVDRRTRNTETAIDGFLAGSQLAILRSEMTFGSVTVPTVVMMTEAGIRIRNEEILAALSAAKTEVSEPGPAIALALTGLHKTDIFDALVAEGVVTPGMILAIGEAAKERAAEAAAAAAKMQGETAIQVVTDGAAPVDPMADAGEPAAGDDQPAKIGGLIFDEEASAA